ncbi:hypothetical protein DL93DRAFT_2174701 [Clavulina sp. PMI_390]|nr:hypothetical protein DL93DRAFT_2174701 [Clavulina sp. PMI_390]
MKIVLFTLLRAVKFDSAVPIDDIEAGFFIVTFPRLKEEKKKGAQLPVLISSL